MEEDLMKLLAPIFLSLILTIVISVRGIKHGSLKTLLTATILNGVILLAGFIWLWSSAPDGLVQLIQAGIYGISFFFILAINIVIVFIGKKLL
ncbi:hypothetical protein [Paenibacillus algicola]|uniref:hypothetical protein n=1 Tax=Paenibacillus algicola TaxID=2565926 RepID=UPI0010FE70CE|nr:hypothetical protein [Paenibacillus algicola]